MNRSFLGLAALALASLSLVAAPVSAASITVKDGAGGSQTIGTTTRASDGAQLYDMDTVVQSTSVDRGAVLTTADTAVTLIPANLARRGMTIENQGAVKCWFSGLGTATEDYHSLLLPAGAIYESRDSHSGTAAISMICNGANVSVYAREW